MEYPPFYVGQKVVALRDSEFGTFKKGEIYKVIQIEKFCCEWGIDIGIKDKFTPNIEFSTVFGCIKCNKTNNVPEGKETIPWVWARFFAPVTSQFQHIEYTKVLEQEKELISVN